MRDGLRTRPTSATARIKSAGSLMPDIERGVVEQEPGGSTLTLDGGERDPNRDAAIARDIELPLEIRRTLVEITERPESLQQLSRRVANLNGQNILSGLLPVL